MSSRSRLHGEELHRLQSWNFALTSLGSHRLHASSAERLPLNIEQQLILFSIYSPTLQAEPAEKERFYSDLRRLLQSTPAADKVLILGDFNARVGRDTEAWKESLRDMALETVTTTGAYC